MKSLQKLIFTRSFLIALIFVSISVFLYTIHTSSHFSPYPEIDTIFAKNFSQENFEKVKIGMTDNEVYNLLGEPLERYNYQNPDPNYTCWQYSTDGKLWPFANFSYYLIQTCFKDGKLESKPVYEFAN